MILSVCSLCPLGSTGFAKALASGLASSGIPAEIRKTACMSGCARPSTLSARQNGKTAYLFGDLTEADLPDILTFARLYHASPDGNFADARPLGGLRLKALARIPG